MQTVSMSTETEATEIGEVSHPDIRWQARHTTHITHQNEVQSRTQGETKRECSPLKSVLVSLFTSNRSCTNRRFILLPNVLLLHTLFV